MTITADLVEIRLQRFLGRLDFAVVGETLRGSQCRAQRALVAGCQLVVGGAGLDLAAADIGQQGAVIADHRLRPFGLPGVVEKIECVLGFTFGLLQPCARQKASQLADRVDRRCLEMLVGQSVVALFEFGEAEQQARHAMIGLELHQLARQRFGAWPVAFRRFHIERLPEQRLVVGVLGERHAIISGGGVRVAQTARDAAGEIPAEPIADGRHVIGCGWSRERRRHRRH